MELQCKLETYGVTVASSPRRDSCGRVHKVVFSFGYCGVFDMRFCYQYYSLISRGSCVVIFKPFRFGFQLRKRKKQL